MLELWAIYAIFSALAFAIKDVITKKVLNKNVKPIQIIYEQYLLLLLFVIIFFFGKIDFLSITNNWDIYLLKAITIFISTTLYFYLLNLYDISLISPLMNLSPVFLIILSSVFLFEKITLLQMLGIFIIIVSTYLLELHTTKKDKKLPHKFYFDFLKTLNWKIISVASSMLFIISITAISDKIIFQRGLNVYTNMFFTAIFIFIFLTIYYIYNNHFENTIMNIVKEPETLIISFFSVLSTFLILLAISIPTALVSLIVPLKRISTLFSSILGGLLFHEQHLFKKGIITILMLFGVVLIVM